MKILFVEDDEVLIALLTRSLVAQRYAVDAVKDGEMGWSYGSTFEYDLIMLDLMLPKLDGISLCRRFRAEGYATPIIMLTAQDNSTAKVQGLDAGADDYVVKPFDQAELIARIRALLRRSSTHPFPLLTCGDLLLDPSTCEVSYNGHALILTTKEYELLELLLRDSQHVLSTDEILDRLWSSEKFPSEATVRSHIRRVRHKLVEVGAPSDFIATLHGRGYYLKAAGIKSAAQDPAAAEGVLSSNPLSSHLSLSSPASSKSGLLSSAMDTLNDFHDLQGNLQDDLQGNLDRLPKLHLPISQPPNSQQQYLTFLNETWTTTQPKSLAQITVLQQAITNLQMHRSLQQQTQAQQVAHKLAGTLGMFGLTQATHLLRQIELWLGSDELLQPKQAELMQALAIAIQQDVENTKTIQIAQIPGEMPLLLVISADAEFNQSLVSVAAKRSIRLKIAPIENVATETALIGDGTTKSAATKSAAVDSIAEPMDQSPNVILLRLPSHLTGESDPLTRDLWKTLQAWVSRYPALPTLMVGDRIELSDRLKVVRWGGKLSIEPSAVPDQVISAAMRLLKGSELPARVMIVDQDQNWLRMLPTLLKPWGLKVTTLADPQQFLTVLQSVTPDLLILDVNMPQINGFELCQILRSDPDWQRLPVIFLSVLADAAIQNQAFTVGADDYLCKPIIGAELANRILHRLQRVRAWIS